MPRTELTSTSDARFQALVQPHPGSLVSFACRRLRNPADAEDVVQEACTRAWLGFGPAPRIPVFARGTRSCMDA